MASFDKDMVKDELSIDDVFTLLEELGAEPQMYGDQIISKTICHNGDSHKLYYYDEQRLFKCFTKCGDSFDIFDLVIKVMAIQYHKEYNLYNALVWIANRFGFNGEKIKHDDLEDWSIIDRYENIDYKALEQITLTEFDSSILDKFNYKVKILPWLNEGISQEAFADKCGMHRTYISAIECYRRSISLENIQRIADALEIETYKLFLEDQQNG